MFFVSCHVLVRIPPISVTDGCKRRHVFRLVAFISIFNCMYQEAQSLAVSHEGSPVSMAAHTIAAIGGKRVVLKAVFFRLAALTGPANRGRSNRQLKKTSRRDRERYFNSAVVGFLPLRTSTSSATRPLWNTWVASTTMQRKGGDNNPPVRPSSARSTIKLTSETAREGGDPRRRFFFFFCSRLQGVEARRWNFTPTTDKTKKNKQTKRKSACGSTHTHREAGWGAAGVETVHV